MAAAALELFQNVSFPELDPELNHDHRKLGMYVIGIAFLVWGFSSFLYFSFCELLLSGQTVGKRISKIRVVKAEGFSLDVVSVMVRNLFRVADHLPLLWIVPVLTSRSQRLGDLAAGTLVVTEQPHELPATRAHLTGRAATEARYRFDYVKLDRLRPGDLTAVEKLMETWDRLPAVQRVELGNRLVPALCKRMQVDEPPPDDRRAFFEDLLAADYRRQERRLM